MESDIKTELIKLLETPPTRKHSHEFQNGSGTVTQILLFL